MSNVVPGRSLRILGAGVGAAAVSALVIFWVGWDHLQEIAVRIGWGGCALMFAIYLVAQTLRTLRAHIGLPADMRPEFRRLFALVALHQWSNHVLPMRLGEATFPLLLARYASVDSARGFSLLIRIRLQEIVVLSALFLAALAFLIANDAIAVANYILFLTIGMILFAMPFVLQRHLPSLISALASRIDTRADPLSTKLSAFLHRAQLALREPNPRRLASTAVTGALWLCMFYLFYVAMRLSGHPVTMAETVVGSSFANVSQLLPINTLGSFGSLEAGWALGFSLVGVPVKDALAAGFIMHLLVLIFITVFAGVGWLLLTVTSGSESEVT